MIDHLESNKHQYIIRIKKNLKLIHNNDDDKIRIVTLLKNQRFFNKIRLQKIFDFLHVTYKIKNNEYYLVTNLLNMDEFPDNKLSELYHARWRIEEYFKFIKTNCNINRNNIKDDINFTVLQSKTCCSFRNKKEYHLSIINDSVS
jgi:IS4 transposase